MNDTETEWMGTMAAAKYIGVTQRTVYRFADSGDLPAYKMGRVLRFKRADLDEYLLAVRVQPGELRHLYPPVIGAEEPEEEQNEVPPTDAD